MLLLRGSLVLSAIIVGCVAQVTATAAGPSDSSPLVAPTEPLSPAEQLTKFHLPPGFTIQLVAAEPDIRKPMNLNFDARGRLYATQSEEYPFPADEGAPHRDVIKRFDGISADGRPASVETVVAGLNIPIGLMPREDGLIYYSIPEIYRAEQPDAAGRYTTSKEMFGKFGFKDTHGMCSSFTRGFDGWVYACHGYANDSDPSGSDGHAVKMNSGNTYRFRPDGSHIEQFTHGQVNPFGMCFDPLGNLYTADCHTKPVYMLLRGAWYPSFDKPHDGLGYGPEMIKHLHGSTGIAGVVYYAADHFPAAYSDTIFIGNPVTGRINHDRLEAHGSTYKAVAQPDFITCEDLWFRPVDLKLGPDGALYIADFYNCIIGHYEVPLTHPRRDRSRGRIWRVVYTGTDEAPAAQQPSTPDMATLSPAQLVEMLGNANLTVRMLAAEQLCLHTAPDDALLHAPLAATDDDEAANVRKAHALWLVERNGSAGLSSAEIERLALDPSRLVRTHLIKLLAERDVWSSSDPDLYKLMREKLQDEDAFVRRAAADALGRHPHSDNLAPLLALWKSTSKDDSHLIHVVRMALRDQLSAPNGYAPVAVLVADDADAADRIADVSLGVRNADSSAYLSGYIALRHDLPTDELALYVHDIVRYAADDRYEADVEQAVSLAADNADREQALLLAAARASEERGHELPAALVDACRQLIERLLSSTQKKSVKRGIELASEVRVPEVYDRLARLASRESPYEDLRVDAAAACVKNDRERCMETLSVIIGDSEDSTKVRQKAAGLLAELNNPTAHAALIDNLRKTAGPVAAHIARGLALKKESAEQLVAEVKAGRASPRLLTDEMVAARISRHKSLHEEIAALTANLPPADDGVDKLIKHRRSGFYEEKRDVKAGHQVFLKTCGVCHKIGDEGTKIGPELHGIGVRGVDRLLEDILDPNRNVDQAYRTSIIETSDGLILQGLLIREDGEVMVLVDSQGKEVRVPSADVTDLMVNNFSPMPSNVAELIPEADFYNLLAFLLEQQQKDEKMP